MRVHEYIAALRREGVQLAQAAERVDLSARVPTCPEWTVRDLLSHIGGVHRWAAAFVSRALTTPMDQAQEDAAIGPRPDDAALVEWYREGHAALISALESAPANLQCWTFLTAPSPLEFWARRQAHETAIHRADAQSPGGAITGYPTQFAVDGIDELLCAFLTRPVGRLRSEPARSLCVRPLDADAAWTVHIGRDRVLVEPEPGHADCVLRGSASDLYLALWNRRGTDDLDVTGDGSVLTLWRERATIRWS
jgi:uncharacterized protein (TIGR03083 family)